MLILKCIAPIAVAIFTCSRDPTQVVLYQVGFKLRFSPQRQHNDHHSFFRAVCCIHTWCTTDVHAPSVAISGPSATCDHGLRAGLHVLRNAVFELQGRLLPPGERRVLRRLVHCYAHGRRHTELLSQRLALPRYGAL